MSRVSALSRFSVSYDSFSLSYVIVSLLMFSVFSPCVSDENPTMNPEDTLYTSGTLSDLRGYNPAVNAMVSSDYKCMEDWGITCTLDSECCSGVCVGPFCKIIGIEKEKKGRKKQRKHCRNKGPTPGKN
ncbi:uncharacterized protein LOC128985383 [Macrosteles quadrilineatus]|uniref:uncharacterized protein LOC128985383 n=1 Tax=Macrosteles quadrilineatus TaxID=74068 RepID=UPI0023E102BE|nr:uncharacterized protein LOC128985383 [Macrosteles quadrilineatus]